MTSRWVWAEAPATIANVGPGFDVFALAIHGLSDEVSIRPAKSDALFVEGPETDGIPQTFGDNTAGIVLDALRRASGIAEPLEVRVRKGIPAARGLGSSAASCAAAALAFAKAFPQSRSLGAAGFIRAAVEGEAAVSGRHYDNVTAALLGGFVIVAATAPLILAREPVSNRVALAIAIPDVIVRTATMRAVLPDTVAMQDAVSNVGRAAALAVALSRGDATLAGQCLGDRLAEPARASLLPSYDQARLAALKAGASGCAISGSGSSVFAFAQNRRVADPIARAMCEAFHSAGHRARPLVTTVNNGVPLASILPYSGPHFSVVAA